MFANYRLFTFGDLLKSFRERQGVSQEELGANLGRSRNTIGAWERGGLPGQRIEILLLETELSLSQYETDLLLYKANYPLEYHHPTSGATQTLDHIRSKDTIYGYLFIHPGLKPDDWFPLQQDKVVIGRDFNSCDLVIPDRYALTSRQHAAITCVQGDIFVEDLDSTNHTFVDGKRIEERTRLYPGQHILLGGRSPHAEVCVLGLSRVPASTAKSHG